MAHAGGRPTIIDEVVLKKLEEVFAIGGTDLEACFYADISHQTLYNYQKAHPEFVERKEALKEKPVLLARQTVVKALASDSDIAFKYLERKRKSEFAVRSEVTGADGVPLHPQNDAVISDLTRKLNELHRKSGIGSDGGQPRIVDTETPDKE